MRAARFLFPLLLLVPGAAAHGDLEIHELETLAIRDFEGQEESFPWEGFEIWDVYVGEGFNASHGSDGVYFKVNFAGDGSLRPTGGKVWTVTFSFVVGDEKFDREFSHDGRSIATSFESLQWAIADGNVLQVKAWVPVPNGTGRAVRDVVVHSSVDGKPRDVAPGGVHDPATGQEIPVQAPGTPVFPPLGEGRVVEEVPLTGAEKYFGLAIEPLGGGAFRLRVTNALEEQGQHILLDTRPAAGWTFASESAPHSLDGKQSADFEIQLAPDASPGATLLPYSFDILTDIGGRRTLHAFVGEGGAIGLTEDAGLASVATLPAASREAPAPGIAILVLASMALSGMRRRTG